MNSCGSMPTLDPLQADEHADAVIDVDDEIADLQIAEVGEERARRRLAGARGPCRSSSKTSVSAQSCRLRVRQAEAAGQVADADEHRRPRAHPRARSIGTAKMS